MSEERGESAAAEVDLFLFNVGDSLYGTDASSVLRVDVAGASSVRFSDLGKLRQGARALVFATQGGEGRLVVDDVRGVQTVDAGELRRLPAAAAMKPYALGIWLDGERPVMLIDLEEAMKAAGMQAAR